MLISLAIFVSNKKKLPDPSIKGQSKQDANVVEMDVKEIRQRIYALFAVFGVVIFFWFSFHQNGQTLTLFANDYTRMININLGFTTLQGAEVFKHLILFLLYS